MYRTPQTGGPSSTGPSSGPIGPTGPSGPQSSAPAQTPAPVPTPTPAPSPAPTPTQAKIQTPAPTPPTESPDPTVAVQYIRDLIKHLTHTILISPGNIQAILNQYEQAGGQPLTPEQKAQATAMWNSLTPEQRKEAFNDALFSFAFTETGEFTAECKKYMQSANFVAPTGVPTIETKKAYSIFTLMIILSELSNFLRTEGLKGMQLQQSLLQVNFDKQINNIWTKASLELVGAIASAGVTFAAGTFGSSFGFKKFTYDSASRIIGGPADAIVKLAISTPFETKGVQIEKERSQFQFDQQTQTKMNEAADQLLNTTIRAADDLTRENIIAALRTIFHNI